MSLEGPPPTARPLRRPLVVFAIAMGVAVSILTAVSVLLSVGDGPLVAALAWLLVPGFLLYGAIHGSLLADGAGMVADFLVVVVASAALWAALYTALHVVAAAAVRRTARPGGSRGVGG
jgi:hypothetical protein